MAGDYERTLPAGARAQAQAPRDWRLDQDQQQGQPRSSQPEEFLSDPSSKFDLMHSLGRGSYGAVYKARMIETGEIVAIKIIPLTEQDEMESIQKEINMLRACNHPNIVKYFGSWRTSDALWIAMEYCAGGSVSDIMHALDSPLEESVISYICAETLAGLAYLHNRGRVHRDIKCGNILLTEGGEVKLADFGVAAQLTSTLSKRNTFIGTPHWMAPEVIQASHYDGKVDVWALGISSMEMAERYPPRWRVNPNRVIFMVVRDPPPKLAEKERWTLSFQDFIAQCLNKDPIARPTARYLQQHRFIARDRADALRALLPAIHKARAEYAAAAEPGANHADTASDDGYFSWRQSGGAGGGGGGGGALAATVLGPGRPGSTASTGAGAMGTVIERPSSGAVGAGAFGATVVSKDGWSEGLQGPPVPMLRPSSATEGPAMVPSAAANAAAAEASVDYMAAVHSAASGALDLDTHQYQYGGHVERRGSSAMGYLQEGFTPSHLTPGGGAAPQSEAQRMVERLYNLHSSGEVVPLPFIQSTDLAPMALLGLEKDASGHKADWRVALQAVLDEAMCPGNKESKENKESDGVLPPMLAARVEGSPVLLNLAMALARHRAALAEHQARGAPQRVLEYQRGKADALLDTLRTILCL